MALQVFILCASVSPIAVYKSRGPRAMVIFISVPAGWVTPAFSSSVLKNSSTFTSWHSFQWKWLCGSDRSCQLTLTTVLLIAVEGRWWENPKLHSLLADRSPCRIPLSFVFAPYQRCWSSAQVLSFHALSKAQFEAWRLEVGRPISSNGEKLVVRGWRQDTARPREKSIRVRHHLPCVFCPVLVCKTRGLFLSTPRFTADFITPHYVDPVSKDIPSQCRLDWFNFS